MLIDNFLPTPASTIIVTPAPTNSSAAVALPTGGESLELYNSGTVEVFVEFGLRTATATVPSATPGSYPVGPGQRIVIRRPLFGGSTAFPGQEGVGADTIATITAAGTGALRVSAGYGS